MLAFSLQRSFIFLNYNNLIQRVLFSMYETEIPQVKDKVTEIVKSTGGRKKLKQYTFPAAKILAQKVL
jgi:hypothetical protein